MKLKHLTIHNIASIEDAFINFEKEPLNTSDVFLITGKTGAGKTTILDAICLALYANTPRLANTNMQGELKDGEKTIKISHPSQLLRRNMGEGYVELSFIGNNRNTYRAKWAIARGRKNPSGNIQKKEWMLVNETNKFTLTKDSEIKDEINKAVGLDFTQFCRTSMLAQGDFSKFLNSEDKEKSEILEKITGMGIYSKIGSKIFELTSIREKNWQRAKEKLDGIEIFSEEQIDNLNNKILIIDKEIEKIQKERKEDEDKRDWIKNFESITRNLEVLKLDLQKCIETTLTEEFLKKEKLLKDWNTSIDARGLMTSRDKNDDILTTEKNRLDTLKKEYEIILKGINNEVKNKLTYEKELQQLLGYFDLVKNKEKTFINSESIVIYLKSIDSSRKNIKIEKNKIESYLNKIKDLEKESEEKKKLIKELNEKNNELDQQRKLKVIEIEAAGFNMLTKSFQLNEENINNLKLIKEKVLYYLNNKGKLQDDKNSLEKIIKTQISKEEDKVILEKDVLKAYEKEKITKDIYEGQKDTVDKFAVAMRSKLKIGSHCPVCQQIILNSFTEESELSNLINKYKKEWIEAEERRKFLESNLKTLSAEIEASKNIVKDKYKEISNLEKELSDKAQALESECSRMRIEFHDENILFEIDTLLQTKEIEKHNLEIKLAEAEKLQTTLKRLNVTYDANREEFETTKEKWQKIDDSIKDITSKLELSNAFMRKENEKIKESESNIKELTEKEWNEGYLEDPKKSIEELEINSKEFINNTNKKNLLEKSIEEEDNLISMILESTDKITEKVKDWKDLDTKEAVQVKNLSKRSFDLIAEVTSKVSLIDALTKDNRLIMAKLDDFLCKKKGWTIYTLEALNKLTSVDIEEITEYLNNIKEKLLTTSTKLKDEEKRKENLLASKPFIDIDKDSSKQIENRLKLSESQIIELGEKRGELKHKLESDKQNKEKIALLIKEIDLKKKEYDKWYRLNSLIGDAKGNKFRKIAQSYVLSSLIQGANHYMNTLSGRYRLLTDPGSFVIKVEDAYQGFTTRSAATLSGGETFIVSLSLALALSDIGENLGVDTLFIDEGFGTLSGEPLQSAITTLRSLHSKTGKHVGIISHVEELQEKIPVQIQVEQDGNNGSSKIRIVP